MTQTEMKLTKPTETYRSEGKLYIQSKNVLKQRFKVLFKYYM